MDLKVFYQKLRKIEAGIREACAVVVSLETPDGGRAGVRTEAPRAVAARLVAEDKARLAEPKEAAAFRQEMADASEAAERAVAASRVQLTVIPEAELLAMRGAARGGKGQEKPGR